MRLERPWSRQWCGRRVKKQVRQSCSFCCFPGRSPMKRSHHCCHCDWCSENSLCTLCLRAHSDQDSALSFCFYRKKQLLLVSFHLVYHHTYFVCTPRRRRGGPGDGAVPLLAAVAVPAVPHAGLHGPRCSGRWGAPSKAAQPGCPRGERRMLPCLVAFLHCVMSTPSLTCARKQPAVLKRRALIARCPRSPSWVTAMPSVGSQPRRPYRDCLHT